MDGAAKGSLGIATCGGNFKDYQVVMLGCFSSHIRVAYSIVAKLTAAMYAIKIACKKGWTRLWLETDSLLVVQAFKSMEVVPWRLQNKWINCLHLSKQLTLQVTHIYRECNVCADKLACHGIH